MVMPCFGIAASLDRRLAPLTVGGCHSTAAHGLLASLTAATVLVNKRRDSRE
jgi:hypothetical protein